jgi:hypothetical protein
MGEVLRPSYVYRIVTFRLRMVVGASPELAKSYANPI